MRPRAPKTKPTVWREAKSLLVSHRAKYTARRGTRGEMLMLEVALWANGSVTARITHVLQPEGRHETLSDWRWRVTLSDRRVVESTVALAKRWCEARADELKAAATELASMVARKAKPGTRPKRVHPRSPAPEGQPSRRAPGSVLTIPDRGPASNSAGGR